MRLILLSGKTKHGKTLVGTMMRSVLVSDGYSALVMHQDDLLDFICRWFLEWDGDDDARGKHGDFLFQKVGYDIIRDKDPAFFSKFILEMISYLQPYCDWDNIIIPDLQLPEELTMYRSSGLDVYHVKVIRPDFTSPLTEKQRQRRSETALDATEPDFYIYNRSDLPKLLDETKAVLRKIIQGE